MGPEATERNAAFFVCPAVPVVDVCYYMGAHGLPDHRHNWGPIGDGSSPHGMAPPCNSLSLCFLFS